MVTRQDCLDALKQAAEELGHSPSRNEYQELDIGPSVRSLKKYLGGSWNAAKKEAGLSTKGPGGSLYVDDSYFLEINTEEKAYWLGMLYGDGSVSESEIGHAKISLALQEEDHVAKFKEAINSNHKLSRGEDTTSLALTSEEMESDLSRHGLDTGKTHSSTLPELESSNLRAAFVRGLFDADGHVGQAGRFNITGASEERFLRLGDWLPVETGIVDRRDGAYTFRVGGKEKLQRLYGWLYPEAAETEPMLNRKYKDAKRYRG